MPSYPGRRRGIVAVLAGMMLLLGIISPAAAQPAAVAEPVTGAGSFVGTGHYVALGDSFAAGPFIPIQRIDPIGCARSTRNYPALVAEDLEVAEFTDVSCSGAVTENMTKAQAVPLGSNPPQFDALRTDTDLVTLSIGGNDIGYSDMILTCGRLSFRNPLRDPCRQQATAGGSDAYAERILAAAPQIADVLRGIKTRAPDATVLLVGYLRILPPATGCWPTVPISRGDVAYLDGLHHQLTTMLAEQADKAGVVYVNAYADSLGRDICQAPTVRWVEGIVPTSPAFPVHPNGRGMRAVADMALDTLTELQD